MPMAKRAGAVGASADRKLRYQYVYDLVLGIMADQRPAAR